jgi:hypothetical protein
MLQPQEIGHQHRILQVGARRAVNGAGEQVQVRVVLLGDGRHNRAVQAPAQRDTLYARHSFLNRLYQQFPDRPGCLLHVSQLRRVRNKRRKGLQAFVGAVDVARGQLIDVKANAVYQSLHLAAEAQQAVFRSVEERPGAHLIPRQDDFARVSDCACVASFQEGETALAVLLVVLFE